MKLLLLTLCFVAVASGVIARPPVTPTYRELFVKADLVVIAQPVSTRDTAEKRPLPGMPHIHAAGVETKLNVSAVLKGNRRLKSFILHYYREGDPDAVEIDGPMWLRFSLKNEDRKDYLLFLIHEVDGRYAPVAGQVDPADAAVFEVTRAALGGSDPD